MHTPKKAARFADVTPLPPLPPAQPRQPIGHVLKSHPKEFNDVISDVRHFELRRDDRMPRFETGDAVLLAEYDPETKQHTGRSATRVIGYVERGSNVPPGWCGFQLTYGDCKAAEVSGAGIRRY